MKHMDVPQVTVLVPKTGTPEYAENTFLRMLFLKLRFKNFYFKN